MSGHPTSTYGHVPVANLEEYRLIRGHAQKLDDLCQWYYSQGRNPPPLVIGAWRDLVAAMAALRSGR